VRIKTAVFAILATLLLIFTDSKFHILLFQDKPNPQAAINCGIEEDLKNLGSVLDTKNNQEILTNIKKLVFALNVSYGYETDFSYFSKNRKTEGDSKTAQNIRDIRSQFDKYTNIDADSLSRYIPEIKSLREEAQETLKGLC
jgi:hypothetical protein